jgi:hypothetical protein
VCEPLSGEIVTRPRRPPRIPDRSDSSFPRAHRYAATATTHRCRPTCRFTILRRVAATDDLSDVRLSFFDSRRSARRRVTLAVFVARCGKVAKHVTYTVSFDSTRFAGKRFSSSTNRRQPDMNSQQRTREQCARFLHDCRVRKTRPQRVRVDLSAVRAFEFEFGFSRSVRLRLDDREKRKEYPTVRCVKNVP